MEKKRFEFETVIKDKINICNLKKEKDKILNFILDGKKVLLYGRRNTGKTSLIEAYIIPEWLRKNPSGFYVLVDLYGVRDIHHISQRIALGFSESLSRTFKTKNVFQSILHLIASLRPKLTVDNEGKPQIELAISEGKAPHFKEIFEKINEIHINKTPVFIIIDEFQDITGIAEAEGLLRNSLQHLDPGMPVIILGSKRHLLSKIFSVPDAPLYNWGEPVEIPPIDYKEYTDFMSDRGLMIDLDASTYLQSKMKRIPEPINIVCYYLLKKFGPKKKITKKTIDETINEIVRNRRGRPQELLSNLSENDICFLDVLCKHGYILKLTSKEVQRETKLTGPGILKIVAHLENTGIIYKNEKGYEIADPFLELHIKKYGI